MTNGRVLADEAQYAYGTFCRTHIRGLMLMYARRKSIDRDQGRGMKNANEVRVTLI